MVPTPVERGSFDPSVPLAAAGGLLRDAPAAPISFSRFTLLAGMRYSYGFAASDFDCDGRTDISFFDSYTPSRASINPLRGAIGYLQWNGGELSRVVQGDDYADLPGRIAEVILFERQISLDVNGDGLKDIVGVVNSHAAIAAYINPGFRNQNWERRYLSTNAPGALNITSGDMDGDGRPDIVFSMRVQPSTDPNQALQGVAWLRNPGVPNGTWTQQPVTGSETMIDVRTVDVGDIDGDGRLDVIASDTSGGDLAWFRNMGTHFVRNNIPGVLAIHGHFGKLIDFDGDGRLDILQPVFQGIVVARNVDGGLNWDIIRLALVDPEPTQLVVSEADAADLDGDGKTEVVFAVSNLVNAPTDPRRGGVYMLRQGAEAWEVSRIFLEDSSTVGVRLIDYDNDGDADIVVNSEYQRNGVSLFLNNVR